MNPLFKFDLEDLRGLFAGLSEAASAPGGRSVRVSQPSANIVDRRNVFQAAPVPSEHAQALLSDQAADLRRGPDERGYYAPDYRTLRLDNLQGELMGRGQGAMVYPGLSPNAFDVQLRQDVEEALSPLSEDELAAFRPAPGQSADLIDQLRLIGMLRR